SSARGLSPRAAATFLTVFSRIFHTELAQRRHLHIASWSLVLGKSSITITRFSTHITDDGSIFHRLPSSSGLSFGLGSRFRQELLEVFQEIRSSVEKLCYLSIHILNRLRLSLIRLKDL